MEVVAAGIEHAVGQFHAALSGCASSKPPLLDAGLLVQRVDVAITTAEKNVLRIDRWTEPDLAASMEAPQFAAAVQVQCVQIAVTYTDKHTITGDDRLRDDPV